MNEPEKLNKIKQFLRKVAKQRSVLILKGKSRIPSDYAKTEINNIEYALTKLSSEQKASEYIRRKENAIRYLIPANFKSWNAELEDLLTN